MSEKHGNAASAYTTNDDFCRIFSQEMNQLYRLALLLTGDGESAERCFLAGMEDCVAGSPVFREWGSSWARRSIIKNAVRAVRPGENGKPLKISQEAGPGLGSLGPVTRLPSLERFVFVMSVLERYTVQECAVLLNATRRQVIGARWRALTRMTEARVASHAGMRMRREAPAPQFWNPVGLPDVKTA